MTLGNVGLLLERLLMNVLGKEWLFFSQNIQVKAINTLFMFIPLFTRQLHLGENVTVFTKTLPTFRQVHNTPAATLCHAYTFKEFRVDVALLSS